MKHFPGCGEDIWECIIEGFEKVVSACTLHVRIADILNQGSINARINILYFLDSLCETCLIVKSQQKLRSHASSSSSEKQNPNLYVDFVGRDLGKIVELVVPQGRQGLPNLVSTKQVRKASLSPMKLR